MAMDGDLMAMGGDWRRSDGDWRRSDGDLMQFCEIVNYDYKINKKYGG